MALNNDARGYHHGDLKAALLIEATRVLETEGINALSLRAVARAAAVSHTAPKHHFGDLAGLMSEVAADGFHALAAAMTRAVDEAGPGRGRARAMGLAYLRFAERHPARFALMFRSERLDLQRPALRDAMAAAHQVLHAVVAERGAPTSLGVAARSAALWSMIHGYATLAAEGRLAEVLAALPGKPTALSLFELVLDSVALR